MTEAELYSKLKPWLLNHGVPSRLENSIGSGMPDVLYASNGYLIYIELKIAHAYKIKFEAFQYSFAMRMVPHIRPNFYWIAVQMKDVIAMYQWTDIYLLPKEDIREGGVMFYIRDAKPNFIIQYKIDVQLWLERRVLLNG